MDNLGYSDHVKYTLISKTQGRVVIPEPLNYDEGNGNIYERDEKSKGFLKTKTNDLQFYGKGYDFFMTQISTQGIVDDVVLEKSAKDDTRLDEKWRIISRTFMDLRELKFEEKSSGKGVCTTKSTEGGLKQIIDSKMNDELDMLTLIDVYGNPIEPMTFENAYFEPKGIFLRTELSVDDGEENVTTSTGGDTLDARSISFNLPVSSDEDFQPVITKDIAAGAGTYQQMKSTGGVFMLSSTRKKRLKLNGTVKIKITRAQSGWLNLDLVRYKDAQTLNFSEVILNLDTGSPNVIGKVFEHTFVDYEVLVDVGESLAITTLSDTPTTGITYESFDTKIEITEASGEFESPTSALVVTYKQALERLLYIITGEKHTIVSDLLTNGKLKDDIMMNGFLIRGFPFIVKEGTEEERKIQFNTSFGDLIEHIDAMTPTAWWTDYDGDKDIVRIETLKYTQQNFIGIQFSEIKKDPSTNRDVNVYPKADNISRAVLGKNYYSKVVFGSEKGGDGYEEVFGLQSVSGKGEFATLNKKNDSTYSKTSKYRLGDIDVELPRRKQYANFPDEDTKYDSDIMVVRAYKLNNVYYPKKWGDVPYEYAPTGVYDVNTAYNLELTPARLLLEHGYVVNSALNQNKTNYVVFSKSNCNSSLITKKMGEDELKEDGAIPNTRLEKPRVRPMSTDLTFKVTQEIEDRITGTTNGVHNWFGLVAVNTGQTIEYFRMVKTDANKEGQHKLVEAFIT